MSDWGTLAGVVLGGGLSLVGGYAAAVREERVSRDHRRQDFARETIIGLQDRLVELERLAMAVYDERTRTGTETTRDARHDMFREYFRARVLTERLEDGDLRNGADKATAALLSMTTLPLTALTPQVEVIEEAVHWLNPMLGLALRTLHDSTTRRRLGRQP